MAVHLHPPRIPQQKRSIDKKNRVVEAAFEVFSRKGYNAATTPDIAREAGISTGTLYAYYRDKKELFLECFKKLSAEVQERLLASYQTLSGDALMEVIERTINSLVELNNTSQAFTRQVLSLTYLDDDVREFYNRQRESVINTIIAQLVQRGIITEHGREKVFLAVAQIETITREIAYNPANRMDPATLIGLCKRMIINYVND
jgi:AcrR family transcriptional regulator